MNHAVDPYLVLALVLGSIFGTQFGARLGALMRGEQLRLVLALVVMGVAIKMGLGLVIPPEHLYSMARLGGQHHPSRIVDARSGRVLRE